MRTPIFYRFFLVLLLVSIVAGIVFVLSRHHIRTAENTPSEIQSKRPPQYRFQIKGFQLDSFNTDKKNISIKADKLTEQKKKLGFFRLGIMNELILENAVIDIYLKEKFLTDDPEPVKATLSSLKETFPLLPKKRISSIFIEPVCLTFQNKGSMVAQITANAATIRLKKRDIVFRGHVKAISGSKRLSTARLILFFENAVMKTDTPFILETPEKKIEGDHLNMDIFLNTVTLKNRPSE